MKNKKISVYDMAVVGLMGAMVFVSTYFLSIRIPTPTGTTMIKVANIICVLSGLLFGGWRGGLAAGFGSAIFDLMTPEYAPLAWFTFIRFFSMGFFSGLISHSGGSEGKNHTKNLIGAIVGCFISSSLYIGNSILTRVMAGSVVSAAAVSAIPKIVSSVINSVVAVIFACILAPVLRSALERAGLMKKLK